MKPKGPKPIPPLDPFSFTEIMLRNNLPDLRGLGQRDIEGEPDARCVPLAEYRAMLDVTIDRILEKQTGEEEHP